MQTVMIIVGTALLSSFLTALTMIWLWRQIWRQQLEQRLRQLQDDMSRTVETRVRRVITESLAEVKPSDMLRDSTWRAAKSGSDLISDSFGALLSRWRKNSDYTEHQ